MLCFERPSMGGGVPEPRWGQGPAVTIWWWLCHSAGTSPTPSFQRRWQVGIPALLTFGHSGTTLVFSSPAHHPPHLPSSPRTFEQATHYKGEVKSSVLPSHFCLPSNLRLVIGLQRIKSPRQRKEKQRDSMFHVTAKGRLEKMRQATLPRKGAS